MILCYTERYANTSLYDKDPTYEKFIFSNFIELARLLTKLSLQMEPTEA